MKKMKERKFKCLAVIFLTVMTINCAKFSSSARDSFSKEEGLVTEEEIISPEEAFSENSDVVIENSGQETATNGVSVTWKQYSKSGNGINLTTYTGVTRKKILDTLEKNHGSYLGVPYKAGYYDTLSGMNCEGFVERVLMDAGCSKAISAGNGGSGWVNTLRQNNISYRTYYSSSFDALADIVVNDGYAQPGDVIWLWDGGYNDIYYNDINYVGLPASISSIHHIGFFVGNYFSTMDWSGSVRGIYDRNGFWHSIGNEGVSNDRQNTELCSINKNTITQLGAKSSNCKYITVIKFANQNSESVLYKNVLSDGRSYSAKDALDYGFPAINGAKYVMFCKDGFVPYRKYWNNSTPTIRQYLEGVVPDKTNNYNNYNDIKALDRRLTYEQYAQVEAVDASGQGYALFRDVPPGTYFIMETEAPEGYALDEKIYVVRVGAGETVSSGNVGYTISEESANPIKITTTAMDTDTGLHVGQLRNDIEINDKVHCENLLVGHRYSLEGYLLDADTGLVLMDGEKEIRAEIEFEATSRDMEVEVLFGNISRDLVADKTLVVYERLYEGQELRASHEDLFDDEQRVTYPDIHTTLSGSVTGRHVAFAQQQTRLIDTVEYSNLTPNKEYTVRGLLVNKKDREAVTVNGEPVEISAAFTPLEKDGVIEVEFVFDASSLAGESVVAYEYIYDGSVLIAVHEDIDSIEQSLDFPKIGTSAKSDSGDKYLDCGADVKLVDTISYSNLNIDYEYTAIGTLMIKSKNQPLMIDGECISSMVVFSPEEKNGEVDVEFDIDTSTLGGEELVVYETIFLNSQNEEDDAAFSCIVAEHKIIEDEGQTVKVREQTTEEITTEEQTTEEITTEEQTTEEITTEEITTEIPTTVESATEYLITTENIPDTKVTPQTNSVKTGDKKPILPIFVLSLMCIATAIAMILLKIRHKSQKEKY